MLFSREDWKLFRNIETLSQKAGVERSRLPLLIIKELVDNALDVSETCNLSLDDTGMVHIKDEGPGIDPEKISDLYSINRPLLSSKLLRKPSRGALGNGLRVVMGGIIAMGGEIFISTKGSKYRLLPQLDGTTLTEKIGDYVESGTLVSFHLGSHKINKSDLVWGENAIVLYQGEFYNGKTSAYWYTSESFFELCNSSSADVETLVKEFVGTTKQVQEIILAEIGNSLTSTLDFEETDRLLSVLRKNTKPVSAKKLGFVGPDIKGIYMKTTGELRIESARGTWDHSTAFRKTLD